MGSVTFTYADHTGEISSVTAPTADLTLSNIDTEYADALTFQAALEAITRGLLLKRAHTAKVAPQAVGKASSEEAQREEKMLVKYHDSVTFKRAVMEIPCADMALQMTGRPGVFYDANYSGTEETEIGTFVTSFESFVVAPGGNAPVVDEIIHVGRNT